MKKDKILYVRVSQALYDNVVKKAAVKQLTQEKYITSLLLRYNKETVNKSPPCKRDKVIYCRISTKTYNKLKEKAEKYNMKLSEYVMAVLSQGLNQKDPFDKALYCRVSGEEHAAIARMAKTEGLTISDYVRKRLSEELNEE